MNNGDCLHYELFFDEEDIIPTGEICYKKMCYNFICAGCKYYEVYVYENEKVEDDMPW